MVDAVLFKADIHDWQAALPIGGWGGVRQGKQAANILDYLSDWFLLLECRKNKPSKDLMCFFWAVLKAVLNSSLALTSAPASMSNARHLQM